MFKAISLAFVFALFVKSSQSFLLGPLHASCKIKWEWPNNSCLDIEKKIILQIQKWNNTDCGEGEKCRYALGKHSVEQLKATHTTPVKRYEDALTLSFTNKNDSGGCQVLGESTSKIWYAVLDYGTNYCNLHNLITGAGLDKMPGYVEDTSNSVCTQYSSANCEKY